MTSAVNTVEIDGGMRGLFKSSELQAELLKECEAKAEELNEACNEHIHTKVKHDLFIARVAVGDHAAIGKVIAVPGTGRKGRGKDGEKINLGATIAEAHGLMKW